MAIKKTKTMTVKKSKDLKPYKKKFQMPYKKVAKTLGAAALLGLTAYGAKKIYDQKKSKSQVKPYIDQIIQMEPVYKDAPKIQAVPTPPPLPIIEKTLPPIPIGKKLPKIPGAWVEEPTLVSKNAKDFENYKKLRTQFKRSPVAYFKNNSGNVSEVCNDYSEFLKYYEKSCEYAYGPRKARCIKEHIKEDKIDADLIDDLIKYFGCK